MNRIVSSLLLTLATLATAPLGAWAREFEHVKYVGLGRNKPYHVISADFNNDGNADLALVDWLSGKVSVLLGRGDGTFQKEIQFAVPSPVDLAAGDFNEDGVQDLAVVESNGTGDGAVAIFLGDGTGRFRLSGTYKVGIATGMVATADLNGDGHLDVAVTNAGFEGNGPSMMTFFGDGHGKLGHPTTYKMPGEQPAGIVAGDLNGDTYPDLAVATYQAGSVAVFMNDGTGKFEKPIYYSVDGDPEQVTIADLRNDGREDLVVADGVYALDVWLNNGDGTFGSPSQYLPKFPDAQSPEACTVADFNLDGKLDVACAGPHSYAYWFRGKGDGTFTSGIEVRDGDPNNGGTFIASGDFNNDGAPDLAIPIYDVPKVGILLNAQ